MRRAWLPFLAFGYAGLIFYLSSRSSFPVALPSFDAADKAAHLLEYAGLGVLVAWSLGSYGVPRSRALWLAAAACSLYGASDEVHQLFVPGREGDLFDWLADSAGGAIGAAAWFWASRKEGQ